MKFYSIKQGKAVSVPEKNIKHRMTSNGRHQLVADFKGEKMYKLTDEKTAKKFM
jgi:hypothetical protein